MSDPAADLVSVLGAFIDEVNAGNAPAALARLTDDVCIIEDLAPFRWTGPEAGGQWLSDMAENGRRMGATMIRMTYGEPQRVEVEGDHGYCIIPGRVTLDGPQVAFAEEGLITFAGRREGGEWRITALTWTGDSATPI